MYSSTAITMVCTTIFFSIRTQVESLQACRQGSRVKVDCGRRKLESIRIADSSWDLLGLLGLPALEQEHKGQPNQHLQSQAKPIYVRLQLICFRTPMRV